MHFHFLPLPEAIIKFIQHQQVSQSVMLSNIKSAGSYLWKDHKYLKIFFLLLTVMVLFQEFVVFFIEKPTLTTVTKSKMEPDNLPVVLICPDPATDLSFLLTKGYKDNFHYQIGVTGNDTSVHELFLWSGNMSENVEDIVSNASVFKTTEDCPKMQVWWNENDEFKYEYLQFTMTRAIFPNHRCCRPIPSENVKKKILNGFNIYYENGKVQNKLLESIKLLLFDDKAYSVFQQNSQTMFGDGIRARLGSRGENLYKVEIKQEIHRDDDPQYPCVDYQVPGDFDLCLEEENTRLVARTLNCAPPWMTDRRELWCGENPVGGMETSGSTYFLFEDILMGLSDSKQCSVPCTKTNFYVNQIGFDKMASREGIKLFFENKVEKRISELQIGPKTLLTRIGGIIGVGKNLLWLLLFCFTSVGSLLTLGRKKCNAEIRVSSTASPTK